MSCDGMLIFPPFLFKGADTLRCLGMATVEEPGPKEEMNLEDSKNFIQYEVNNSWSGVRN